jgi:hypothetical protein
MDFTTVFMVVFYVILSLAGISLALFLVYASIQALLAFYKRNGC